MNKDYTNNLTFRIIVFLSLFTLFLGNNLSGEYFYFSCYVLILTFGIVHGANDILILLKGKIADRKTVINKTLKYFFKRGGKIFLEAANPSYEPIELNLDEVVFQGKLLAVWRKI